MKSLKKDSFNQMEHCCLEEEKLQLLISEQDMFLRIMLEKVTKEDLW